VKKTMAIALACCFVLACGGGGAKTAPPGLSARFTASDPNPVANTMSMTSGGASGPAFEVQILATGIGEFFGTGFHVVYDPGSASFVGHDCSVTFLPAADLDCRVDGTTPGVVIVSVTRQGQLQGIDVLGTDLLLALTFRATSATAGNAFDFDATAPRFVKTCPAPPAACSDVVGVTWSGGTLTAN
jgi:hypothetical protein